MRGLEVPVRQFCRVTWSGWVLVSVLAACGGSDHKGQDTTDAGAPLDAGADDAGGDGDSSDATTPADASLDGGGPSDASVPDDAGSDAGPSEPDYLPLFDPSVIQVFEITLSQEAMDALDADPDTYQHASFKYGETQFADIGVRRKGRASSQPFSAKPGLKLKFNEYVPGQKLLGLKRVTLNNMVQDDTFAREYLGFRYLRTVGIPAPLANYARVYINGEYYGLYLNLQTLDEEFVEDRFEGGVGNLYDITNAEYHIDFERGPDDATVPQESKFELETNEDMPDTSDLTALIDRVSMSPDDEFLAATESILDLNEVLLLGAAQAVLADWDGYFGARNNYKIYHDLAIDRFVILPWGIDQTFWQGIVDYPIDHSESMRPRCIIYNRCETNATCLARYRDKVAEAVTVFESLPLDAELTALYELIGPAIEEDMRKPHPWAPDMPEVMYLRDYLRQRPAFVRAQLMP